MVQRFFERRSVEKLLFTPPEVRQITKVTAQSYLDQSRGKVKALARPGFDSKEYGL
jgi:hypothetical protein